MKKQAMAFNKALSVLLSFIPHMEPWRTAGLKMFRDPLRHGRGSVDRYAGKHPRRDHPHTKEMARRVSQGRCSSLSANAKNVYS